MAFAARREDGKNRLCKRMGNTIGYVSRLYWPDVEIAFPSQAKAKACADELNEHHWKAYEKASKGRKDGKSPADDLLFSVMLDVIRKHEGLTDADYRKVRGE